MHLVRSVFLHLRHLWTALVHLGLLVILVSCTDGKALVEFLKPMTGEDLFPGTILKISGATSATGNSPTPTVVVSGFNYATKIELFTSSTCAAENKVGEVLVEPSATSASLTPLTLTQDGTYGYYALLTISENLPTSCSLNRVTYNFDTTAPAAPKGITLKTLVHNSATPELEISGLEIGSTVSLYADAACTISLGTSGPVDTTLVNLTSKAISEGIHNYYAKSVDTAGNASTCSTNYATYVYDITPPLAPTELTLAADILRRDNNTTPTLVAAGLTIDDTLKVFADASCLTEVTSVPITDSSMTVTIMPALTAEGDYSFHAKTMDPYNNASACSTVEAAYTLDLTPPAIPRLTLAVPSTSPANIANAQIQLNELNGSDWLGLFSDSTCSTLLVSANTVSGTTVVLDAPALASSGTYTYFARAKDAAGNMSSCSSGLTYVFDNQAPTPLSVTSSNADKTFGPTATINIHLTLDEAVNVATTEGLPTLTLNTTPSRVATYDSGSGTNQLTFKYTIQGGDSSTDLDYASTTALILNGASITDLAGNALSNSPLPDPGALGSLGANKNIVITGKPPTISLSGALSLQVLESAGAQNFELTLNYDTVYDINVHLTTYDNAILGVDYNLSTNMITIPAGSTTATFSFTPVDNGLLEAYPRRARLSLDAVSGTGGGLLGRFTQKEILLIDNEAATSSIMMAVQGATAYHSCALKNNGDLKCWGYNFFGQVGDNTTEQKDSPVLVDGLSGNVQAATLGGFHTCAIKKDNSLWCWGYDSLGQLGLGSSYTGDKKTPTQVDAFSYLKVTAGLYHTCAIRMDNTLWCWGSNTDGQLGNALALDYQRSPIQVEDGTFYSDVFAGEYHTCAITLDGALQCWGYNYNGQVGNGTSYLAGGSLDIPTPVSVDTGVTYVTGSGGYRHTCAVTSGGALKCWGNNDYGQLGSSSLIDKTTPTTIISTGVVAVSAGGYHTCARFNTTSENLKCWGGNWIGQLGIGEASDNATPPTPVAAGNVTSLSSGYSHTCVGLDDGGMKCWGNNDYGQLGLGKRNPVTTPTLVESNFAAIATGDHHSCGLTQNGAIRCWGDNTYGQIGDGTNISRKSPLQVLGSGATQVAVSYVNSCAVLTGGKLVCWGYGADGRLGIGTYSNHPNPITIIESGVSRISMGNAHACALMEDTSVKCWGYNGSYGAVGNNSTTTQTSPVQVIALGASHLVTGQNHSCALVSGTMHCWGNNLYGQFGNNSTTSSKVPLNTGITMDSLGIGHAYTCGISAEKLYCWGSNSSYVLGDGTNINKITPTLIDSATNYRQVVGADYHTCAVTTTGSLKCWGDNNNVGLYTSTPLLQIDNAEITQASIGLHSVCARFNNGEVQCLGNNNSSQLGLGFLHQLFLPLHVFNL